MESLLRKFWRKPDLPVKLTGPTERSMADKKLKITLVKSTIGAVPKNKAIVESMGLRKIGKSVVLPDNDATRGQIRQVNHLIKVEEA